MKIIIYGPQSSISLFKEIWKRTNNYVDACSIMYLKYGIKVRVEPIR